MGWIRRLRNTILCSDLDEFDDEARFHLEQRIDDYLKRGMSYEQAEAEARRRLGNLTLARERTREADTLRWLDDVGQDLRYAARILRKNPGLTLAAVLSLALGIGANTAIFSLINALLLHHLPVTNPEQLVLVADPSRGTDLPPGVPNQLPFMWNYRMWEQVRQRPELFESACGYFYSRFDLAAGGETEFVDGLYVSGGFFHTLGVSTIAGRPLTEADDQREAAASRVAVIGHDFWQRRFGGAPDVIGRPLNLDRVSFTIIGVLPPGFVGPAAGRAVDIAIPLNAAEQIRGRQFFDGAGVNWITIMARLNPGQTLEAATAALRGVQPQIRDASRAPSAGAGGDSYLKTPLTLLPADRGNSLDHVSLFTLTACLRSTNFS